MLIGFGERLRRLRIEHSLSQAQLARRLGVSKSLISAYETDLRLPSYDVLISISKIFSISTDYLLENETKSIGNQLDLSGLTLDEMLAVQSLVRVMKQHCS